MDYLSQKCVNLREILILDVRTPREFSLSHIPQALNFPVLNDQEHQEIGTLYRKDRFGAKKLGSAYICRNIANFLDQSAVFHPKNKLLLYCSRGGQRSKSLWLILKEIGFDCERLEGGYKSYRKKVIDALSLKPKQSFITLYGMTGCGKSELVRKGGAWAIDLEGLCKHYGSSFGDEANSFLGQPTQAMFENELFGELENKSGVLLVEGESKKLGRLVIPNPFFEAMHGGVKVLIEASMPLRVKRIVQIYSGIKEEHFLTCMQSIRPYIQKCFFQEVMQEWGQGNYEKIALILLEKYYDRVYRFKQCDVSINADDLNKAYAEVCALKEELISGKFKQG